MLTEDRIRTIANSNEIKVKATRLLLVLIISLFVLTVVVAIIVGAISISQKDIVGSNFFYFVLGTVVSLLTNLLTAIFWERLKLNMDNGAQSKKIKDLQKIADADLLSSTLIELNSYNNIFYKEHRIDAALNKHPSLPLFNCSVTYEYKKLNQNTTLKFKFIRVKRMSDAQISEEEKDYHFKYEYYYRSDERSFGDIPVDNSCYRLLYLEIDDVRKQENEIAVFEDENSITYIVQLDNSQVGKELSIKYTIQHVIEEEGFTFFIYDFPAHGVDCNFNYSALKDEIDFYSYYFTSAKKGLSNLHRSDDLYHSYKDKSCWALPKSNFLFVWYKKDQ